MMHPTSTRFRLKKTLLGIAAVSLLVPMASHANLAKGRWIADGYGRSARDGLGSLCVGAGGDTHAFEFERCTGAQAESTARIDALKARNAEARKAAAEAAREARAKAAEPVEPGSFLAAGRFGAYVTRSADNPDARPLRDGYGRACVRDGFWAAGLANERCDGQLFNDWRIAKAADPDSGLAPRISMPPPEIDPRTLTAAVPVVARQVAAAPEPVQQPATARTEPETTLLAEAPLEAAEPAAAPLFPDDDGPAEDTTAMVDAEDDEQTVVAAADDEADEEQTLVADDDSTRPDEAVALAADPGPRPDRGGNHEDSQPVAAARDDEEAESAAASTMTLTLDGLENDDVDDGAVAAASDDDDDEPAVVVLADADPDLVAETDEGDPWNALDGLLLDDDQAVVVAADMAPGAPDNDDIDDTAAVAADEEEDEEDAPAAMVAEDDSEYGAPVATGDDGAAVSAAEAEQYLPPVFPADDVRPAVVTSVPPPAPAPAPAKVAEAPMEFPITRYSIEGDAPPPAAASVPAAQAAACPPVSIQMEPARFDFGLWKLRPQLMAALDDVAEKLRTARCDAVTIIGHTDRLGSRSYNQKLSVRRAEAAKRYLVEKRGIDAALITVEGKGKTSPVTSAADCKGKRRKDLVVCLAPDRRIEVVVRGGAR